MDSEVQRDGRILDLIDDAWREDKLPYEDVAIPLVGYNLCQRWWLRRMIWSVLVDVGCQWTNKTVGQRNESCGLL